MRAFKYAFIAVALSLTACKTVDPIIVTGHVLDDLGNRFVDTATRMEELARGNQISPEQYEAFRQFGLKFQSAYPAAIELWKIASLTRDAILEKHIAQLINDLAAPLAEFVRLTSNIFVPAKEVSHE